MTTPTGGWRVYAPCPDDHAVQVVPENDTVGHDTEGLDCACGPNVDWSEGTPIVTHHSLDNREANEQ